MNLLKIGIGDITLFVITEFYYGLRGEYALLLYLKRILELWNDTRGNEVLHNMLVLWVRFIVYSGNKWYLFPTRDKT